MCHSFNFIIWGSDWLVISKSAYVRHGCKPDGLPRQDTDDHSFDRSWSYSSQPLTMNITTIFMSPWLQAYQACPTIDKCVYEGQIGWQSKKADTSTMAANLIICPANTRTITTLIDLGHIHHNHWQSTLPSFSCHHGCKSNTLPRHGCKSVQVCNWAHMVDANDFTLARMQPSTWQTTCL